MSFWLVDRFLPGALAGLLVSATIGVEHLMMKRHLTRITREQTTALKNSSGTPGE